MEENRMGKSTITISIASYNNGAVIERCVDSAISQSYTDTEILIIDDGSTDDTLERLKKYDNIDNVRVIEKENGGLSSVRQRGLEEAKGKYICFIDADDYLERQYVENMYSAVLRNKADVCVCSTIFENEIGEILTNDTNYYHSSDRAQIYRIEPDGFLNLTPKYLSFLFLSDSWNKLYRTAFLRNSLAIFCMPKGLNGTDSLFNQVLFLHSPAYITISYGGYHHVIYKKSAVHRKQKDLLSSFMAIINRMKEDSITIGLYDKQKDYIQRLYANYLFSAYSDVYSETKCYQEALKLFKIMYDKNTVFLNINSLSLPKVRTIDSITVKLFIFFIKRMRFLLPLFFLIRKKRL